MKVLKIIFLLVVAASISVSCSKNSGRKFGIFTVQQDNSTIEMDGEIKSSALKDFNKLLEAYPNVNKINIKNCGGSSDDEINLQLSALVNQKAMSIHISDNGEIASGGVDFFLAGIVRTKGSNTKIGVHSWAGGSDQATDFPVGHANHLPYINYYVSIGFTQQQAEDFYYFTINAASANSIHWMTEAEIVQYSMLTQ